MAGASVRDTLDHVFYKQTSLLANASVNKTNVKEYVAANLSIVSKFIDADRVVPKLMELLHHQETHQETQQGILPSDMAQIFR